MRQRPSRSPQPRRNSPPAIAVVVAAGGRGARVGTAVPKQFLDLAGRPVLLHTIEGILELESVTEVVIALPAGHLERARRLLADRKWSVPIRCVRGGSERQHSVRRAVKMVRSAPDLIMVHDAVRPLCDPGTMRRVAEAAWRTGGAVPGLPPTETIQRISRTGRILKTPPRAELVAIQTPQCFRAEILRAALDRAERLGFTATDESSLVRWAGHPVALVPGSASNIKITRPLDLVLAERLLTGGRASPAPRERSFVSRIGHGIDYHRLQKGRKLVLGGVEIPFEKGLVGHSDADVLSHAVADALLGAAGLGDIGRRFPDSDPRHRSRSSLEFLREIRGALADAGWAIANVDATILAQKPKLARFFEAMRTHVADSLGVGRERVSIKATTTETMNAEGRGEGISAHAVALLQKTIRPRISRIHTRNPRNQ